LGRQTSKSNTVTQVGEKRQRLMMYPSITMTTQIEYKKDRLGNKNRVRSKENHRRYKNDDHGACSFVIYIYTVHDGEDKAGTKACRGGGRGSGR